jgi:hypothetical protein
MIAAGHTEQGIGRLVGCRRGAQGGRTDLVVVAQSFAGFTAPLVCERVAVDLLVMLAAMVPSPGESPRDWWANTGHARARREQDERDGRPTHGDFDVMVTFFHDVPPDVVSAALARGERYQSGYLPALSRPKELVDRLEAYRAELRPPSAR